MSDVNLVERCLRGDNSAFDTLVRRYQKKVYGFCLRMLGNPDDALDAAQDSFMKAYNALDTFRRDARFSSWLFGIANNACIDLLRRRTKKPADSLDQLIENEGELSNDSPGPERLLLREEDGKSIRDALARLPENRRAVMVMFHFNGMTIKEISQALRRPEDTVKSDLHKAREAMRRKLEGVVVET
ncbi:MAG TPA: sigma-70 family RNA polymerase sigma factor [Armatimonadota bacterium]